MLFRYRKRYTTDKDQDSRYNKGNKIHEMQKSLPEQTQP